MKITNGKIYNIIEEFSFAFNDFSKYLPVKINFPLQKNISILQKLAQEIEDSRMAIGKEYGVFENGVYKILPENMEKANKEMEDLFNIEQEVKIKMIKESDLDGFDLTMAQMSAIMFMIEENE